MEKKTYKPSTIRPGAYVARMPETPKGANVVKRYRVNYTTAQKVKLGMLPLSALEEELAQKEREEEMRTYEDEQRALEEAAVEGMEEIGIDVNGADSDTNGSDGEKKRFHEERVNHTFWEDDDADRPLIPQDEYEEFLKKNNITIGGAGSGFPGS